MTIATADPDAIDATLFHLRQLAYLREVTRLEGFTRAADALGVSQPALSQSLADLERRLGVPLFERDGRLRRLTDEGREVLAFAERTLADLAGLRERLTARRLGEAGVLRVGMIDAASLYVLPAVIGRYRALHPEVGLSLLVDTSTVLVARLRSFELELAFVVQGPHDERLRADEVLREPLFMFGPPAARSRTAPPNAEWVLYPAGSRTRAVIDAGFAALGIRPRVALESHNPEVLRQMAALGLGWTVLPLPVAAHDQHPGPRLRQGSLVAERVIVGVRRHAENPRAEAFLALTREPPAPAS
ncbi:MAG: LysR family transcriptional regulator [Dehalococcoidia bacterium]